MSERKTYTFYVVGYISTGREGDDSTMELIDEEDEETETM